ncbi:MAG: RNA-binding transcriptional accessory protein, partial [Bacteroidetes bacterium]|nr:RNA-binding transcriptional accessory protein [Bacteroidota bacterium]
MQDKSLYSIISNHLGISLKQVSATIKLIDEGATVPFISRYRKEATMGLDEVEIENIKNTTSKFRDLEKRKLSILETIKEQGKLTPSLEQLMTDCWDSSALEDIYLPYKPKRKTKASTARENGLEPLALWLLKELPQDVLFEASKFINEKVNSEEMALQGARDIIGEMINENSNIRSMIRLQFEKHAVLYTKVSKGKEVEGNKYQDYFSFDEPLNRCPSHRLLAVFRGEEEGFLKLSIEPDEDIAIKKIEYQYIKRNTESSKQLALAIKDAYKRLLAPSMENEFRSLAKARADEEAIKVFAENLRQLLLSAPLGNKRILAIDPGFRSGCKVVCLNEEGRLLADDIIYPHEPQRELAKASEKIKQLVQKFNIEAIAVGNGTAGRETEELVRNISFDNKPEIY